RAPLHQSARDGRVVSGQPVHLGESGRRLVAFGGRNERRVLVLGVTIVVPSPLQPHARAWNGAVGRWALHADHDVPATWQLTPKDRRSRRPYTGLLHCILSARARWRDGHL